MSKVQISKIGAWPGGTVVDLAVSAERSRHGDARSATVLAATFAGIYRSTDGGQSWQSVGSDLPDWFIQAVALAPMIADAQEGKGQTVVGPHPSATKRSHKGDDLRQGMAWAASHMGWLYRSTDGGETWETASYWRDSGVITRLVPSPNFVADGIVFACTEEDGIFKSSDRGRTWKSASFGLLNLSVTALVFSPNFAQDEIVFAGTDGGGLFRSRNAGRAWRESGEGLPNSAVQCLAISPTFAKDGTLFAGTEDRGLYRSVDGGRTWSPPVRRKVPPALVVQAQAARGGRSAIGESLSREACINSLYLSPDWSAGGGMIAATDEGILVSVDAGQTWHATSGGPDYPYVVVRSGAGLLAGAYDEGVYCSTDGDVWQACNGDLAAHLPPAVCFSEAFEDDHTLLMASLEGGGVRSTDAGQTWEAIQGEEDGLSLSLLSGTGEGAAMTVLASAEGGLACSRDSGETWELVEDVTVGRDPVSALALSQTYAQDSTMLVGTSGGEILISSDGGTSWTEHARFVPDTRQPQRGYSEMVVALACCTEKGGRPSATKRSHKGAVVRRRHRDRTSTLRDDLRRTCYAVTARQTQTGMWQLTLYAECRSFGDEGEPWQEVISYEMVEPVAVLRLSDGGRLFCAMGQLVLCLEDSRLVSESELESTAPVSSLIATADGVLAGTHSGLYRSVDNAQSWEWVTHEIPVVALHAASSHRCGESPSATKRSHKHLMGGRSAGKVYAVSMGGRLWKIELP